MIGLLREKGEYNFDLSHKINIFQFERHTSTEAQAIKRRFKDNSILNTLEGIHMISQRTNGTFVYYMNIIKTVYNENNNNLTLNQYTLSKYESTTMINDIPGVIIKYDIAPIYVYYEIKENSSIHFVIRIISILGGVITVAGLIASLMHTSSHRLISTLE